MEIPEYYGGMRGHNRPQYEVRLAKAKAEDAKEVDGEKVLVGYQRAKALFDASHSAFSSNAEKQLPGWYPDARTIRKMQGYLEDMKIFHVYAMKRELYDRRECCDHDKSWWFSRFATVSNIVVDVAVALTIVGEGFYQEALDYYDGAIDNFTTANVTTVAPESSVSFWGVAAVSTSVLFSKLRVFAQSKAAKAEASLARLTKVLGDSKLVIQEYQNKLDLWEKTSALYRSRRGITRRDCLAVQRSYKAVCKVREPALHYFAKRAVLQLYARSTGREVVCGEHPSPQRVPSATSSERSPIDVRRVHERRCCVQKGESSLDLSHLIDIHNQITFAREFVAQAVEEVNCQMSAIRGSDYYQSLQVIEEQKGVLEGLFGKLDEIPESYFTTPTARKVIRAISLGGIEVVALVTMSIGEYRKELGEPDTAMKVVAITFFIFGGVFSAASSCIHREEMKTLKLAREVSRLKGLKWVLKDLDSIAKILRTHQRWSEQVDSASREQAFSEYMRALEQSKGKLLGLKVSRMLKKLRRGPDSLAYRLANFPHDRMAKNIMRKTSRSKAHDGTLAEDSVEELDALQQLEVFAEGERRKGRLVSAADLESVLVVGEDGSPDSSRSDGSGRSRKTRSEMRACVVAKMREQGIPVEDRDTTITSLEEVVVRGFSHQELPRTAGSNERHLKRLLKEKVRGRLSWSDVTSERRVGEEVDPETDASYEGGSESDGGLSQPATLADLDLSGLDGEDAIELVEMVATSVKPKERKEEKD